MSRQIKVRDNVCFTFLRLNCLQKCQLFGFCAKNQAALFNSLLNKTPSAVCTTICLFYDSVVILCLVMARVVSQRVRAQVHAKNMTDRSLDTFPEPPPLPSQSHPSMCAVVSLLCARTHAKRLSVRPGNFWTGMTASNLPAQHEVFQNLWAIIPPKCKAFKSSLVI